MRITVRKNIVRRIYIRFFVLLFILSFAILAFCFPEDAGYILLIAACGVIPALALWLYYETWQVVFQNKTIRKKRPFLPQKEWSFSQIKDVYIVHSYTEYDLVRIIFREGSVISFRTDDDNGHAALKLIRSHKSVENRRDY